MLVNIRGTSADASGGTGLVLAVQALARKVYGVALALSSAVICRFDVDITRDGGTVWTTQYSFTLPAAGILVVDPLRFESQAQGATEDVRYRIWAFASAAGRVDGTLTVDHQDV